jgi:acyl carrier protein
MPVITDDAIRQMILDVLAPKLAEAGARPIDDDTNLVGLGLVDSADLLEVIVLVEEEAGREFNPEGLDLESGLTLRQLVGAFVAPSASGTEQARTAAGRR